MPSTAFRIAIIGAGPAGLTLAGLLTRASVPYTVFELRPKPTHSDLFDQPAGPLDMHEESGLDAIRALDLYDDFVKNTGDCAQVQKIVDKNGDLVYLDDGGDGDRPEISRGKLTGILMTRVPGERVKWGWKLKAAIKVDGESGREEVELDFGEKGKERFDFVVGCDGAWSKVRGLLTDRKPDYTGWQNITLNVRGLTAKYPHLAELVGTGTFTCLADRHGVFTQRSVHDSIRMYIMIHTEDEGWVKTNGSEHKTPTEAKRLLIGEDGVFSTWGEKVKELIDVACEEETAYEPAAAVDVKPLCRLTVPFTWQPSVCATLIGDAAHLMNPGAGEGVNQAMKDALQLSRGVIKAYEAGTGDADRTRQELGPLLQDFEMNLAKDVEEMSKIVSWANDKMFGGNDGSAELAEGFRSFRTDLSS